MEYTVIITASGKGERANLGYNKVFYVMKNGKTVLENAARLFIEDEDCKKIIVVTSDATRVFKNEKVEIIEGGKLRANSVYNGLNKVETEYVLIHDGARPFITKKDVENLKEEVTKSDGVILAKKATDTVKLTKDGYIIETLNRENIYLALTPQAFKTNLLKEAYDTLDITNCTDDAMVLERYNHQVKVIEGNPLNIKLTNPEDFENL